MVSSTSYVLTPTNKEENIMTTVTEVWKKGWLLILSSNFLTKYYYFSN